LCAGSFLRGAKQQSTKFELYSKSEDGNANRLDGPLVLLGRADGVIE
jgi:hypothetical protein